MLRKEIIAQIRELLKECWDDKLIPVLKIQKDNIEDFRDLLYSLKFIEKDKWDTVKEAFIEFPQDAYKLAVAIRSIPYQHLTIEHLESVILNKDHAQSYVKYILTDKTLHEQKEMFEKQYSEFVELIQAHRNQFINEYVQNLLKKLEELKNSNILNTKLLNVFECQIQHFLEKVEELKNSNILNAKLLNVFEYQIQLFGFINNLFEIYKSEKGLPLQLYKSITERSPQSAFNLLSILNKYRILNPEVYEKIKNVILRKEDVPAFEKDIQTCFILFKNFPDKDGSISELWNLFLEKIKYASEINNILKFSVEREIPIDKSFVIYILENAENASSLLQGLQFIQQSNIWRDYQSILDHPKEASLLGYGLSRLAATDMKLHQKHHRALIDKPEEAYQLTNNVLITYQMDNFPNSNALESHFLETLGKTLINEFFPWLQGKIQFKPILENKMLMKKIGKVFIDSIQDFHRSFKDLHDLSYSLTLEIQFADEKEATRELDKIPGSFNGSEVEVSNEEGLQDFKSPHHEKYLSRFQTPFILKFQEIFNNELPEVWRGICLILSKTLDQSCKSGEKLFDAISQLQIHTILEKTPDILKELKKHLKTSEPQGQHRHGFYQGALKMPEEKGPTSEKKPR